MIVVTQPSTAPATEPTAAEPTSQPATEPTTQAAVEPAKPTEPATLQLTQERLDQIISDRLSRAQQTWQQQQTEQQKRIAAALGIEDPNAPVDPAKALEEAQSGRTAAETRADKAEAKALALAAGIKPERVARFVQLVDITGALTDVDRSDEAAVSTALAKAVEDTLADVPEFKGTTLPSSSGGDRTTAATGTTLEQFKAMDVNERTKLFQSNPALYRQLAAQEKS